ncbi:MAG: spore germination protein [Oscillospiraceae bacterium]|nr:spore germination protein [Oscillospiraceae bacterium]
METGQRTAAERYTGPLTEEGLEAIFGGSDDWVSRNVRTAGGPEALLMYIEGLCDGDSIAEQVLRPLTEPERMGMFAAPGPAEEAILSGRVYSCAVKRRRELGEAASDLLDGSCLLIFPGTGSALSFQVKSKDKRPVGEPRDEKVLKGARDAFVEPIRVNTGLVRRRLKNPDLRIVETDMGSRAGTKAAVVYIEGFTSPALVDELKRRVENIRTEGIITSAALEENIADRLSSPFPTLISTERPDKFCLNILEGRVGILADGLPMGYLAPGTFAQFFKAPEDSANHFIVGSILTVLRYLALLISLLLPAFYVSVATYHHEMLPTKLMMTIIQARQSVPFPTGFEALAMLTAFELLQEAGLRLPQSVGQTVSIIGALVVGDAAVSAKMLSPEIVIVVALAGISGYTMPNQDMGNALRICRFLLVICAAAAGMFGLAIGCGLLIYHLCSLESCGVPYMTPLSGGGDRLSAFIRRPSPEAPLAEPALKTQGDGSRRTENADSGRMES